MALDLPHSGPLPCGTVLDELIAQVTEGRAPVDRAHQAACRYCEAALQAIQQAWEEFQRLARAAVAVPEGLTQEVMSRVRSLARATDQGLVMPALRGRTTVSEVVVSRLARSAAGEIPQVGWAGVMYAGEDAASPGAVVVALGLVVDVDAEMPALAERVRERVAAAVRRHTGAGVARVDVAILDVIGAG